MPVDLLTPLISAAVLILAPIVAAVRGGLRSWVVVDLAKFILLWLYFLEEPNLHLWAERSMNIWFWVFLGWLSFVPSLAAVIWLLYTRRMAEVEVVLPVDAERPAPSAATKKIYEILSRSYDTDQPDLAERHNEHQP